MRRLSCLLRFLASAFVCRLVLYFELGGMRKVAQDRECRTYRWIVQARGKGTGTEMLPVDNTKEICTL